MSARFWGIGVALVVGASAAMSPGCAGKEALDPNATAPVPTDAGPPDAPPTDAPPVTPIREIVTRNPLGGPPRNLLADGDFDLSIVPAQAVGGQYGWNAFTQTGGQVAFFGETGGICRTGIRCGRADKGDLLFGRGTAAPNKAKVDASIWLKPLATVGADPSTVCKKLANVTVVKCDTFDTWVTLKAAASPAADGWCEYTGVGAGSTESLCMLVDLLGDALLDSAVMLPAVNPTTAIEPYELDVAERDKLRSLAPIINGRMRFAAPPPLPDSSL